MTSVSWRSSAAKGLREERRLEVLARLAEVVFLMVEGDMLGACGCRQVMSCWTGFLLEVEFAWSEKHVFWYWCFYA